MGGQDAGRAPQSEEHRGRVVKKPGYSEEDGLVVLRMTPDDCDRVLLALGFVAGSMSLPAGRNAALGLVNRLMEGNPKYLPYTITAAKGDET